jgi:3-methyladenine DNA glycosylase/8-oxoguanine DNA glycosylase
MPEEAVVERDWLLPYPVDVRSMLGVHARGPGDPAFRVAADRAVWRTSLTPEGPATLRVTGENVGEATKVRAQAWGPGADWLLETVPAQLGAQDDPAAFDPSPHPVVAKLAAQYPPPRLGRSNRVFEALVPAVLEQKVVILEAHRAWRYLMRKYGTPAPGPAPAGLRVFPSPAIWRSIPSWDWHKSGIEFVRARTIMNAAAVASSLERNPSERALRTLPGIGVWTAAEIRQRAVGDPDALSVGDYHLPNSVGWVLEGRRSTDDATMLELLEPYRGHRHRVAVLIEFSGHRRPRRGPRMTVRDYRAF